MRRQYLAIKKQYSDAILFFRLGDFYETFDDDAKIVAEVCDVVLTSRPVGADERVPLAGVPYHSVDPHIAKLVAAGYKVAIAEQLGSEPPPGEKLVERTVRRIITAGTIVEPALLDEGRNNYLAAVVAQGAGNGEWGAIGLAYADITTGEFAATELAGPEAGRLLREELARLQPAEVLIAEHQAQRGRWSPHTTTSSKVSTTTSEVSTTTSEVSTTTSEVFRDLGGLASNAKSASGKGTTPAIGGDPGQLERLLTGLALSRWPAWRFEEETARQALLKQFEVETLASFGCDHLPQAVRAAGALAQYLRETQRAALPQLVSLRVYSTGDFMTLDEATRRNLELTQTIRGGAKKGSLLGVLDVTRTPMGSRLLRRRLHQPLLDLDKLTARLDSVQAWYDVPIARAELRELLRRIGDLERWTNRAAQGIARPQDLVGIRQALACLPKMVEIAESAGLRNCGIAELPEGEPSQSGSPAFPQSRISAIQSLLEAAIADEPPVTLDKGGVIRKGYSAELDGIAIAARDAKAWVANLERAERERTGIKSLKVGFNKVFGYYIEITTANSQLVPDNYIRKQTLVNAERYITPELKEYENLILNAEEQQLELETEIYRQVMAQVGAAAPRLLELAQALAKLDVSASLAEVAANHRYVRPLLASDSQIEIVAGRHPVVELSLRDEPFQPNDIRLSPEEAVLIITGPNMSGKSVFLRQVALITLMAQIGSFVPAEFARIGLVDRIFTRIGAQDEIHADQSTFMVEMVEAANILHHATSRSLIIFDELGRGTSTYDGLAIAWAVVEYIHNHPRLRAKTLFATHYHELTDLAERLPHVVNYNVAVAEQGDTVVFLHKIVPGAADKSYGIHVAQLAGLPRPIIHRAEEILEDLETQGNTPSPVGTGLVPALDPGGRTGLAPAQGGRAAPGHGGVQLTLFGAPDPVAEAIKALDINALSPLEALNKLYELQKMARSTR